MLTAVALWGLAFGGAASLFQTASARLAGRDTDLAQSMIVTTWNLAIAGGGVFGGAIVGFGSAGDLAWSAVLLLALTGCVVFLKGGFWLKRIQATWMRQKRSLSSC